MSRALCAVAASILLAGCRPDAPVERAPGPGPGVGPGGDSGPPADSGGAGACAALGFSPPVTWTLPPLAGAGPWRSTGTTSCTGTDQVLHALEDVDGDGHEDLVLVRDCADADGTGDDHWVVFLGTGAGWSTTGTVWALPPPGRPYGWGLTSSPSCDSQARARFDLADVTGDGRPDLVVFDDCDAETPVGQGAWRVHAGGAGGFESEAALWTLSGEPTAAAFAAAEQRDCGVDQTPRYALTDADADGIPDLLLTGDCGAHPGLGTDHWRLLPGTGAGFDAAAARRLALPDLGEGVVLPMTGSMGCQSPTDLVFGFGDVDMDGPMRLIIGGYCDGRAEPGTTRWDTYPLGADGFATAPEPLVLPDLGVERAWLRGTDLRCGAGMPVATSFWDANGDGIRDVLVREMCAGDAPAGLGVDHYRLWLRGPDLTLSGELRFELPVDPEGTLHLELGDDYCGHEGDEIVGVRDLDGDSQPDLVTSYGCSRDGPVGWTEWGVSLGGCLDRSR